MRSQKAEVQVGPVQQSARPLRTSVLAAGALVTVGATLGVTASPALSSPVVPAQVPLALPISFAQLSPIVALLAGILILIVPRLLNYVVAVYLILSGLIGLFAR